MYFWTPPESSGTFWKLPYTTLKMLHLFRNPKYDFLYINLYLSTIPRLLVTAGISSGTPNNIWLPLIKYPNTTLASTNVKRATLRVRELCSHDRDTSRVNNEQRNLDAHIGSYIFYKDLYRSNRYDNMHNSLCHRYVTCPRFDRRYLHP